MIPWDQLPEIDRLRNTYSDLHKDVTGYRPDYEVVDSWDIQTLESRIAGLVRLLEQE